MCDEIIHGAGTADETALRMMGPVSLAFVGDAVFGLLVREHLIAQGVTKANELHRRAVTYVRAGAQALSAERLHPLLTPEEQDVFRRGRNANTTHVPRNANPADYRYATGLEALFGYLYLGGRYGRVREIFAWIVADRAQNEKNR